MGNGDQSLEDIEIRDPNRRKLIYLVRVLYLVSSLGREVEDGA